LVDVWLPYGNTEVCLRIATESFLGMIQPNEKKAAENPQEEIERSLNEPIGTRRLLEIVKPDDKISIVVNGAEDPSFNLMILKSIVRELNDAGAKNENINVIGGYDPLRIDAKKIAVDPWHDEMLKGVDLTDHNYEAENVINVGETSFGTKVYLNRRFAESKIKVLAGLLEPHPYLGYSGGRGAVLPGVSSLETIQHNLSMVTDPRARPGSLEGNPVHEDAIEAARLVGVDFTLNVVRNRRQEIVKAFAGDLDEAFKKGVRFADEIYKVPIDVRADVLFVSPGGFSHDANLYESCKGMNSALEAVKKNGVLALVAECSGGYGNRTFYEYITKFKDSKRVENSLKKQFTAGGYIAYCLMKALERVEMILVSALPDYYALEVFKLKTAKTVNEALRYALATKKNARVLAISHGNVTIPIVKQP